MVNIFLLWGYCKIQYIYIVEDVILGYLVAQQDNLCIDHRLFVMIFYISNLNLGAGI